MNHTQQLKNLMKHYNFKTKKELQTQIKQILHNTELGEIIQNDDLLQDLLTLHPQYNSNTALYFTVSLDSEYKTRHFSFCDNDSYSIIGISYLSCIKGRIMN